MIRVFPRRTKWTPTDELAFVGDPPLFRPSDRKMPVRVSVAFTWDMPEGARLARAWGGFYDDVQLGGPACGDPGGEFIPGQFLKEGCTITSRGCIKSCGFCLVPTREGGLRELEIKAGWIVQDNNLLACSRRHIEAVFGMLRAQDRRIYFNGGLDKYLLRDWHRPLLDSIKIGELWFACDTPKDIYALERAADLLDGIPLRQRRCYTMIGYNGETLQQAEERLEAVLELGFLPFCQLYQPESSKAYPDSWRKLCRRWARPAIYRSTTCQAK